MLPQRIVFILVATVNIWLATDAQNIDYTSWSYSAPLQTTSTGSVSLFDIPKTNDAYPLVEAGTGPMLRGGTDNVIPNAAQALPSLETFGYLYGTESPSNTPTKKPIPQVEDSPSHPPNNGYPYPPPQNVHPTKSPSSTPTKKPTKNPVVRSPSVSSPITNPPIGSPPSNSTHAPSKKPVPELTGDSSPSRSNAASPKTPTFPSPATRRPSKSKSGPSSSRPKVSRPAQSPQPYWTPDSEPAGPGIFLHQVYLQDYDGKLSCGGSLISEDLVLTAAHCLDPPLDIAKLNVYDVKNDAGVEKIQICETLAHPGYVRSDQEEHDIAILRLCTPSELVLNGTLRTIKLNSNKNLPLGNQSVAVSGWGENDKGEPANRLLQKSNLSYVSEETCSAFFSEANLKNKTNQTVTPDIMCVYTVGVNVCRGDSGSALVIGTDSTNFVQVGVANHVTGVYACPSRTPAIFARISEEIEWILEYGCCLTKSEICGIQTTNEFVLLPSIKSNLELPNIDQLPNAKTDKNGKIDNKVNQKKNGNKKLPSGGSGS